jgi:hypothetical protein
MQTDGQTDTMKLIVAFRVFANTPKNACYLYKIYFNIVLSYMHACSKMCRSCSVPSDQRDAQIIFYAFISIYNSTCFEHILIIIRRDKLYQYNLC